ncbi:hypothetical protein PR048_024686 [Dryococelus australis]|uniref:Fibronectin type-III domain-containing protein n=1 Tax=Dryococelus australis TaxID=614101 RepID=A0ABQ9GP91_9NEOP|nr:hypothetical protein PR048_024686 [Dryococelus australis]
MADITRNSPNPRQPDIVQSSETHGVSLSHNMSARIIRSNQSLVLQKVTRQSAGKYVCVAVNEEGETISNELAFRVKCESSIIAVFCSLSLPSTYRMILNCNRNRFRTDGTIRLPSKRTWFDSQQWSLPDSRMWELCRPMPSAGGFFSGICRFPCRCIPALLHTHLTPPSSALINYDYNNLRADVPPGEDTGGGRVALREPGHRVRGGHRPAGAQLPLEVQQLRETIDVAPDRYAATSNGTTSVLRYTPVSDLDYGTLSCWADNSIGTQAAPCVFQVVAAGKTCRRICAPIYLTSPPCLRRRRRVSSRQPAPSRVLAPPPSAHLCSLCSLISFNPLDQPHLEPHIQSDNGVHDGVTLLWRTNQPLAVSVPQCTCERNCRACLHQRLNGGRVLVVAAKWNHANSTIRNSVALGFEVRTLEWRDKWEIVALNTEVLRADECEARCVWSSAGIQGWRKREIFEKIRRSSTTSGTIPTRENPGASLAGNRTRLGLNYRELFSKFEAEKRWGHKGDTTKHVNRAIAYTRKVLSERACSKPFPVRNCTLSNHTSSSAEVSCQPGFDGGLPQYFVLELYSSESGAPRCNLTSADAPNFFLANLEPDVTFRIAVFAVNSKGRSAGVVLEEVTFRDAEKRTGWCIRWDCSSPTRANRVRFPATSITRGNRAGAIPLIGGFSRGSHYSPRNAPYSPRFTLIGSQDLDGVCVGSAQNLPASIRTIRRRLNEVDLQAQRLLHSVRVPPPDSKPISVDYASTWGASW